MRRELKAFVGLQKGGLLLLEEAKEEDRPARLFMFGASIQG